VLPLSSASANMAAPFGFGSAIGNFITNPKDVLEVKEENIKFEISGTLISADITYKIVNSGEDADFTFIFPALNPIMEDSKYAFKVMVFQKEIPYEAKSISELMDLLKGNYEKVENLTTFQDRIYFDPLTGEEYVPPYTGGPVEKRFFVFDIFLKKGISTEVKVDFKSYAGFDSRRHQRLVYHYYYILNVKDFYKSFENVKISIIYPKTYPLKSNLEGNISEVDDKKILTIMLNENFNNLSFSYMESRISKIGIFLYKNFPFLYGEALGFFLIFFVLPLLLIVGVGVIIYFLIIRKRKIRKRLKL
jgi:hypothetical protein